MASNNSQNKRSRTFKGRHRKESAQNILKWYNAGPNKNISGYCKSGELFAFLGPIACRSGIIKELAGIHPYGGTVNNVFLDDAPMTVEDSTYIDISCADELYSDITVLDTLTYSAELRVKEKSHAAELTALRLLKEMGLKDIADQTIGEISIWQRRMILLATQVAAEYGIVFFDTPTRDLDASSCVAMIRAMQNIARSDDHQTNMLVISINSMTFREYVRLDRVQLLLKYTGVNFNEPDADPTLAAIDRSSYQNTVPGHSTANGGERCDSKSSGGAAAVGASSIFFGPGSFALTYFVHLGRMPTPGASISDFLMDLVESLRLSELVLLEREYMQHVAEDEVLFPGGAGSGVGAAAGCMSPAVTLGATPQRCGLNISPRRRSRNRSMSGSLSAEEYDNLHSIQPFVGLGLSVSVSETTTAGRELGGDEDVQLSSYGIPLSGSEPFSLAASIDRFTPALDTAGGDGASGEQVVWLEGIRRRWREYSVDLCLGDIWVLLATCFGCCYDAEEDEFAVPFVGRQLGWCLWRAFAVRCHNWRNVVSIWVVSGVLVALSLACCTAGTLTLDDEGIYRRLLLLMALPYMLILLGCMWNVDDAKDKAVFIYERTQGFHNVCLFSPLCSLIADICVYRLAPPVIAAASLYPMVGLQLCGEKFGAFVSLLVYISVAGACFSKAVLTLLGAISSLNYSKISIITGVLVTTFMLSVVTHDFHTTNTLNAFKMEELEHADAPGVTRGSVGIGLNTTSIGTWLPNVSPERFLLKDMSLFYKGCYAMFWNEVGSLRIERMRVDVYGTVEVETLHGGVVLRELGLEKISYDEAVAALLTHIFVYCALTLLFAYFLHRGKYSRSYYVSNQQSINS